MRRCVVTEVGKLLRIIRINNNNTAKEMADKIEISSAYLSAIENGKRNVPTDFYDNICNAYDLSPLERNKLKKAIAGSMNKMQIDMGEFSDKKKQVLFELSQRNIDDATMEKLCQIIKFDADK